MARIFPFDFSDLRIRTFDITLFMCLKAMLSCSCTNIESSCHMPLQHGSVWDDFSIEGHHTRPQRSLKAFGGGWGLYSGFYVEKVAKGNLVVY